MNTVLGIDLGTQSLKVVFYDYGKRELTAAAAAPLDVLRDGSGRAEQEAVWWLDALRKALGQVPADVRGSARAVGVSGQQHGFVPVSATGEVLAPVKLWCDTATQEEVDEITAACGGRHRCIELAGNPVLAGYTAPKIRWLAKHHPNRYREMARIMLPHDYLNFVLTGVAAMEHGDASGTALLDVRTRRWSPELLQAVDAERDLADCLPPLVEAGSVIGTVSEEAAQRYGLPAGIPVAPGGGDNMMAAIGTGNVSAGKLTMSLGTSGTLFAYADSPVVDAAGNIAAFCSSTGGWLPLLCTMNCTLATELMKQPLDVSTAEFDATISAVEPGSEGLILLPFFTGERTPNLPRATASLLGMTAQNCSRGHILRATAEGATYAIRFGLDELRRLGIEATEIILTGGGARSAAWRQIVADVCALPVTLPAQDEGASFGAALQALWVLQRRDDPSLQIAGITDTHVASRPELGARPDPANARRYERAYAGYRRALEHLTPLFEQDTRS
ncbi:MAG: xylulokinase [Xanthomonadales bacterium]|nr:xylulokinase [Xanthomonadales bacterium]